MATSSVLAVTDCPGYTVVKEVSKVPAAERAEIVATIKQMKTVPSAFDPTWNSYDYFAHMHVLAAGPPPASPHAHWSFAFWHREFMNRWNKEMQRVSGNPKISWPYWDFFSQASTDSMLNDLEYIGGRGKPEDGYVLKEGNLRTSEGFPIYRNATWWPQASEQGAILRSPGNGILMCMDADKEHYVLEAIFNLPDQDTTRTPVGPWMYLEAGQPPVMNDWMLTPALANANIAWTDGDSIRNYTDGNHTLSCKHFASTLSDPAVWAACLDPWRPFGNTSQLDPDFLPNKAFSPCLEGFDPDDEYAQGLERLGATLHSPHGKAHQYIGGSVNQPSAPSDPIFAHIHMNVDRLFRMAQLEPKAQEWSFDNTFELSFFANPQVTVGQVLDTAALGYLFDSEAKCPPPPVIPTNAASFGASLSTSLLLAPLVALL